MIEFTARPRGINSSLMMWHAGQHISLYSCLVDNYTAVTKCIYKFDHYLEMMLYDRFGCSSCVNNSSNGGDCDGFYLQDMFPSKVVDYVSIRDKDELSKGDEYAIICFPLKPKPHEVKEAWLRTHWSCEI